MKFSHRIVALAIVLMILLVVFLFYDVSVFRQRKSKLVDSHMWPIKVKQQSIIEDQKVCEFSKQPEPSGVIDTGQLLQQFVKSIENETHKDPRVLFVAPKKPNIDKKTKLKVFVIPHSHNDPGWLRTLDDYYQVQTKLILDNLVRQMHVYKNMTFIWGETVFLAMWWDDITDRVKNKFRALINEGRLEIVNGGWVAPDEATTTFTSFIDVLIEGHQWLIKNLGIRPKVNWSPDPFGYSATVPYLLNRAGMNDMVILRVHENIKDLLRDDQNLEFQWQQKWDKSGKSKIFCHTMPYMLYSVKYSCGPSSFACLQFDFRKIVGEYSESLANPVSKRNILKLSQTLVDQLQRKAENYKTNVVFMPVGDDFRYDHMEEWTQQYTNFLKLMKYINKHQKFNVDIRFGTLKDYFHAVHERIQSNSSIHIPVLNGDFYPYTDRDSDYWTGYYSTRPFYKQLARELEANLRDAEILNTLAIAYSLVYKVNFRSDLFNAERLEEGRRHLALFQHHDAITGTSKPETVDDYELKLWRLKAITNRVKVTAASYLLSEGKVQEENSESDKSEQAGMFIDLDDGRGIEEPFPNQIPVVVTEKGVNVYIFNSLARKRTEVVRLRVILKRFDVVVLDKDFRPVKCQINPIWTESVILPLSETDFELIFQVDVPPLGFSQYTITFLSKNRVISVKDTAEMATIITSKMVRYSSLGAFNLYVINFRNEITLENKFIIATFSQKSGFLKSITTKRDGLTTLIEIQFLMYTSQGSGAYLFYPLGHAEKQEFDVKPKIRIISGSVYSEVRVIYPILTHIVRVYHSEILKSEGLEIINYIDIGNNNEKVLINDREVIMRVISNINNKDIFYTDMNGYQMMQRKYLKPLRWQGNYYPMTNMMYIEDISTRLSILAGQSHGVASLKSGWMEVMLDRKLTYDDNRGLGEGVGDSRLTISKFLLLLERHEKDVNLDKIATMSYPSLLAHNLVRSLENPVVNFIQKNPSKKFLHEFSAMKAGLPCDVDLLSFKTLLNYGNFTNGIAMLLHRTVFECNFPTGNQQCTTTNGKIDIQNVFDDMKFLSMTEMSLSLMYEKKHLSLNKPLELHPMEISMYLLTV